MGTNREWNDIIGSVLMHTLYNIKNIGYIIQKPKAA